MQTHGFTDLIQNKLAVAIGTGGSEVIHASSDLNVIGIHNTDALKKHAEPWIEAMVKTRQNGRITNVPLTRRVEVKNPFQDGLLELFPNVSYRRLDIFWPTLRCHSLRGTIRYSVHIFSAFIPVSL